MKVYLVNPRFKPTIWFLGQWLKFFGWIATYTAFRKYVIETHGLPESMDPQNPPFREFQSHFIPSYAAVQTAVAI